MEMKYYGWFILLHFHFNSQDVTLYAASRSLHKKQCIASTPPYTHLAVMHIPNKAKERQKSEWKNIAHVLICCLKVRRWATNWNVYMHHRHHLIAVSAEPPPARWQWKCARRKIGPTYLWMFLSILLFRFPALLISSRLRAKILHELGMFAIGWTHKLHFIMPYDFFLFEW